MHVRIQRKPVKQGFFGIFEVFVDTIVICTLTALVILCSGVSVGYGDAAGAELTILGFTSTYGSWVSIFTAIAMCCFAISTIIGWGLYGTRCVEFLLGTAQTDHYDIVCTGSDCRRNYGTGTDVEYCRDI